MADIVKLIYKGDEMAQGGGSASVDPATTSSAGTVKIATDAQFKAGTEKSGDDYLMPTIPQLFTYNLYVNKAGGSTGIKFDDNTSNITLTEKGQSVTKQFVMPVNGIIKVTYTKEFINGERVNLCNINTSNGQGWAISNDLINTFSGSCRVSTQITYFVEAGATVSVSFSSEDGNYNWDDVVSGAKKAALIGYILGMEKESIN